MDSLAFERLTGFWVLTKQAVGPGKAAKNDGQALRLQQRRTPQKGPPTSGPAHLGAPQPGYASPCFLHKQTESLIFRAKHLA